MNIMPMAPLHSVTQEGMWGKGTGWGWGVTLDVSLPGPWQCCSQCCWNSPCRASLTWTRQCLRFLRRPWKMSGMWYPAMKAIISLTASPVEPRSSAPHFQRRLLFLPDSSATIMFSVKTNMIHVAWKPRHNQPLLLTKTRLPRSQCRQELIAPVF